LIYKGTSKTAGRWGLGGAGKVGGAGDGGRGGNSSCGHYLHSLEKGNICLNPNRILIPGSKRQTPQWR